MSITKVAMLPVTGACSMRREPKIKMKDIESLRKNLQIGAEIILDTFEVSELNERIMVPKKERVTIVKTLPNMIIVRNLNKPNGPTKTITYKQQLLFQDKNLSWESTSKNKS